MTTSSRLTNYSTVGYLLFVVTLFICIVVLTVFFIDFNTVEKTTRDIVYTYIFDLLISLITLRGLYLRVRYSVYVSIATISFIIFSDLVFSARLPILFLLLIVSVISLFFLVKNRKYYNFPTRLFDRPELSIAIIVILVVLLYGIIGTLAIGNQFRPSVNNVTNAVYYTGEVVTTLGFGDIVPVTYIARIFTVTLSIIGIASFFGSATVIAGPLLYSRSKRVIGYLEKMESSRLENYVLFLDFSPLLRPLLDYIIAKDNLVVVAIDDQSKEKQLPEKGIFVEENRNIESIIKMFDLGRAKRIILAGLDDGKNVLNALLINSLYPDGEVKQKIVSIVNVSENASKLNYCGNKRLFHFSRFAWGVAVPLPY